MSDVCNIVRVGIENGDPVFDPIVGGVGGVIGGFIGIVCGFMLAKYCCYAKIKHLLKINFKKSKKKKQHLQDLSNGEKMEEINHVCLLLY